MSSPFGDLSSSDSSSYKPRYRQSSGIGLWLGCFALVILTVGGGVLAFFFLHRAGVVPGSEHEAAIRAYCQDNFHDPSGLEILNVGEPEYDKGTKTSVVVVRLRAKTAGGNRRLATWLFEFKDGKIIRAEESPD